MTSGTEVVVASSTRTQAMTGLVEIGVERILAPSSSRRRTRDSNREDSCAIIAEEPGTLHEIVGHGVIAAEREEAVQVELAGGFIECGKRNMPA